MTQKEKARLFDRAIEYAKETFRFWVKQADSVVVNKLNDPNLDPARRSIYQDIAGEYRRHAHENWRLLDEVGMAGGLVCPCGACQASGRQAV